MEGPAPKAVLICGLGRLGQHCAVLLKELGVPVYGLHHGELNSWKNEGMQDLLDRFTVGDCRRHSALEQAGIASCRAVLLTTSDERANVSAALAARSLNPSVRLVIRSSQTSLNELLEQRLGNLMALDLAELPATAFSLAALGDETVGLFRVDGQLLRVVEKRITAGHKWNQSTSLHDLNTRWRRVLHRTSATHREKLDFHGWNPGQSIQTGDLVVSIELNQPAPDSVADAPGNEPAWRLPALSFNAIAARIQRLWTGSSQAQRLGAMAGGALMLLHITGMTLYKLRYPEVSLLDAFNVATVLIFDGYSNMFAQLKLPFPISLWLLLFSLLLTMSGAVVMGMLYAYLTARVLSTRLQFRRRSGRIPHANHVVVIGMGPLGRRIAELLTSLDRRVVGVSAKELDPGLLANIPVITSDPRQSLAKANCATAASVVVVTDDDVANLELALMSAQLNGNCNFVIRTDDAEFGRDVRALAPHTQAMSVYALSAEAYAAATLGEKVLSLLRIGDQTVLATEYEVTPDDTLHGRLLAEVTCGYGLVAILYQRNGSEQPEFFPSDDIRLEPGSRLVVLATIEGLQNVEHGTIGEAAYRVRVLRSSTDEAAFEGARTISRVTGCKLGAARELMAQLPATLATDLFHHQAERLVRELGILNVDAEVLSATAKTLDAR